MGTLDDIRGLPERMDRLEKRVELLAPYAIIIDDGVIVRLDRYTGQTWVLRGDRFRLISEPVDNADRPPALRDK